jgi:FKBP-type peptidyl-prolyl cis-trans isomerase
MKKGGKAQLVCPSTLAYGDAGSPPKIKPGATLIFDVELLDIGPGAKAPAAPAAGK